LKLLRGEVIGAYPALRDPRGRACSDLYHAVALANISSLWGTCEDHLVRLNIPESPIVKQYRAGKVQRTPGGE